MEREEIQFTFELQETQKHGRNADKRAWRGKRFSSHFHFKRHRSTGEMLTRGHGEGRDSVHTFTSRDTEAREKCRKGDTERRGFSLYCNFKRHRNTSEAREKCRKEDVEREGIKVSL